MYSQVIKENLIALALAFCAKTRYPSPKASYFEI